MKRKRFLAVLTAASLSASMALTAMPVFAGDVVSVEASDANTVTSPVVDANSDADARAIANELAAAIVTTGASTASTDNWNVAGTTYTYGVDSVSDVTFKVADDGRDIEHAYVTLGLSVRKASDNSGQGTATIVVDLLDASNTTSGFKYTATQKIAAVKAYAEANAKIANDNKAFDEKDNRLTIADTLNLDDTTIAATSNLKTIDKDDTNSETQKGSTKVEVTYATGTVVKPGTTDGFIPYTLTYKAKDIDVVNGVVSKTEKTDSSSLTGVIPKSKAANDSAYATKIQNAVAAATWTSDDFYDTASNGKQLTDSGKLKLANIIKAADDNTHVNATGTANSTNTGVSLKGVDKADFIDSVDSGKSTYTAANGEINVSRFTDGVHGKDGAAHIQFFAGREDNDTNKVDSFDVDVTIKEGDSKVQAELADAFKKGVLTASTSLKATGVASQADAVKVITDAIDTQLARSYNGKTYASDIKSYEVVVPTGDYQQATSTTKGNIKFYIKVDTGRTSASDPSKTDVWYFRTNVATTAADFATTVSSTPATTFVKVADEDAAKAADKASDTLAYITNLKEVDKVAATSISLPSTYTYNVNALGDKGVSLKDVLTIIPKGANNWTIRWTNSNDAKYDLKTVDANGATVATYTKLTTGAADTLPVLAIKDASEPASTIVTAELLDDDGNVVSSASMTVTAKQGFDDVQNRNSYYYTPVNNLSSTKKVDRSTKYYVTTNEKNGTEDNTFAYSSSSGTKYYYTTDLSDSSIVLDAPNYYKVVSSPVVDGVGNNKFDPAESSPYLCVNCLQV